MWQRWHCYSRVCLLERGERVGAWCYYTTSRLARAERLPLLSLRDILSLAISDFVGHGAIILRRVWGERKGDPPSPFVSRYERLLFCVLLTNNLCELTDATRSISLRYRAMKIHIISFIVYFIEGYIVATIIN
jgi:hypothetical protein